MKIDWKSDQPTDEAAAKKATGKSLGEWFAILDKFGGPAKGRREIGQFLLTEHKMDPWWTTTINIEYEAAHGLREKDGRAKGYMICATKAIKAEPEACYAAFASAKALDAWLGPGHKLDFKDGGELRNADGNHASIKKITPGKTIKLIWLAAGEAVDTPIEVKFQGAAGKTTVMITHDRLQTRAAADGMRRAWGEALDRLKAVLA